MTKHYQRSGIRQYNDLSIEQQVEVMDYYFNELSDAHSTGYVICDGAALPLSMFLRIDHPTGKRIIWDGVYATSAFSGYFIRLSSDFTTVLVADRHF